MYLFRALAQFCIRGGTRIDIQPPEPAPLGLTQGSHVFLGRSHKKTNTVFRLVNPVYDMDMYMFKVTVFTKQAKYE